MKKLVSLILVGVLSSSLFAGVIEHFKDEVVHKSYTRIATSDAGNLNAMTLGTTKASEDYYNVQIGTLQSNIQNLQLPTASITVATGWQGIFYRIESYINSAKNEKEYYYRTYQYTSAIFPDFKALQGVSIVTALEKGDPAQHLFDVMLSMKKSVVESGIINTIIFSQLIDVNSNDSFAKKHFQENGLQAEWDKMRGELGL